MERDHRTNGALRARGDVAYSQHGRVRQQQRCIPPFIVEALIDYGDERHLGGGTSSFSFSKRGWKHLASYMGQAISAFEKYRNAYLVLAENGEIITVAWRQ